MIVFHIHDDFKDNDDDELEDGDDDDFKDDDVDDNDFKGDDNDDGDDDDDDQVEHPTSGLILLCHVVNRTQGKDKSGEAWLRSSSSRIVINI